MSERVCLCEHGGRLGRYHGFPLMWYTLLWASVGDGRLHQEGLTDNPTASSEKGSLWPRPSACQGWVQSNLNSVSLGSHESEAFLPEARYVTFLNNLTVSCAGVYSHFLPGESHREVSRRKNESKAP